MRQINFYFSNFTHTYEMKSFNSLPKNSIMCCFLALKGKTVLCTVKLLFKNWRKRRRLTSLKIHQKILTHLQVIQIASWLIRKIILVCLSLKNTFFQDHIAHCGKLVILTCTFSFPFFPLKKHRERQIHFQRPKFVLAVIKTFFLRNYIKRCFNSAVPSDINVIA